MIGAPAYMAPEVAEGQVDEVDQATDVYLLGGCLYHILTGHPPRRGSSHSELIELARAVDPVPPREKNRRIPRSLEAICLKAMSRRKQARYGSAEALAEDVRRYMAGEAVSAYREGVLARAWRWAKRHRVGLGRAAAAVLVLGLALFGTAQLHRARMLEAREAARAEVRGFRRLADEVRFFAASTNPLDQRAPYYDARKAVAALQSALAICRPWGEDLAKLPLPDTRDQLKEELSELLLLRVQARLGPSLDPGRAEQLLATLKQARLLRPSTRSYYRLQSELFRVMDMRVEAARSRARRTRKLRLWPWTTSCSVKVCGCRRPRRRTPPGARTGSCSKKRRALTKRHSTKIPIITGLTSNWGAATWPWAEARRRWRP